MREGRRNACSLLYPFSFYLVLLDRCACWNVQRQAERKALQILKKWISEMRKFFKSYVDGTVQRGHTYMRTSGRGRSTGGLAVRRIEGNLPTI